MARLGVVPVAVAAALLMACTSVAAASWTWRQPPGLPGASYAVLGAVSCPSASACMAVGASAIPPRASSSYLGGVSCHTPDTCVAVGSFTQPIRAVPLAEHESPGATLG